MIALVLYHRYRGLCRLCHTDETEVYLVQEKATSQRFWVCPICFGFHRHELLYARDVDRAEDRFLKQMAEG